MTCPKCRGRVRGGICDGCGAKVASSPGCTHDLGPLRRAVYVSRDGQASMRDLRDCRLCGRVVPQ